MEIEEINYQMFFEDSLKVIDLNDHANREYMDWSLQGENIFLNLNKG